MGARKPTSPVMHTLLPKSEVGGFYFWSSRAEPLDGPYFQRRPWCGWQARAAAVAEEERALAALRQGLDARERDLHRQAAEHAAAGAAAQVRSGFEGLHTGRSRGWVRRWPLCQARPISHQARIHTPPPQRRSEAAHAYTQVCIRIVSVSASYLESVTVPPQSEKLGCGSAGAQRGHGRSAGEAGDHAPRARQAPRGAARPRAPGAGRSPLPHRARCHVRMRAAMLSNSVGAHGWHTFPGIYYRRRGRVPPHTDESLTI